jgi:hypothetical protein
VFDGVVFNPEAEHGVDRQSSNRNNTVTQASPKSHRSVIWPA